MRYVSIRVVDSGGRTKRDVRVALEIHQFLASGIKAENTDSNGLAQFSLDVDDGAEVTVMVNGSVKLQRGPIKSEYFFTI